MAEPSTQVTNKEIRQPSKHNVIVQRLISSLDETVKRHRAAKVALIEQ